MSNRNDLPSTSAPNFNQRLRETVQTYLGRQGDPLDRGLTLRDLIENGIIKFKNGFSAGSSGGGKLPIAPVVPETEKDLTPPPTPTGFNVSASISYVFIEHDPPLYTMGHGHLRTHVYGAKVKKASPLPVFTDAVDVGQFSGDVWAMPTDPATTWRLWIKWESVDGVLSVSPAGGTNGLEAITGQDVGLLLEALAGKITSEQLFADLAGRIDLVDGTGPGSVSDRLLKEAAARGAAIQTEQTARQTADTSLAGQITTLSASTKAADANLAAALQNEITARTDADTAESAARRTLTARVESAETSLVTKATITQVAAAKADAISASAAVTDTISARLNTGDYAAVRVQSSANASAVTGLLAQYTVKVDVAGLVSGFGLASSAKDAAPTSSFGVRASNFYVAPPSVPSATPPTSNLYKGFAWLDTSVTPNVTRFWGGTGWSTTPQSLPFVVQTSPTVIDGLDVPAGVYMDAAFIKTGTITNAMIGKAAIDDAKIANLSASKIKAGSIGVGEFIQSTSFIASKQGWRINGDGTAEFGAASIRGQLAASQIDTRGLTIKDANGNVIFGAGSGLSANYVTGLGQLATQNAVFASQVSGLGTLATQNGVSASQVAGLGSLATQSSVSASQVSGLGGLATQSSVNWNTHITNIPGFQKYAFLDTITSANIGTYIQAAAIGTAYIADAAITSAKIGTAEITTAKIGEAQIDTLRIAGNSITIPIFAANNTSTTGGTRTVWSDSFHMPHAGSVILLWRCQAAFFMWTTAVLYLNGQEAGSVASGAVYNDSPVSFGYGTVNAGINSARIDIFTGRSDVQIYAQRIIIWSAMR